MTARTIYLWGNGIDEYSHVINPGEVRIKYVYPNTAEAIALKTTEGAVDLQGYLMQYRRDNALTEDEIGSNEIAEALEGYAEITENPEEAGAFYDYASGGFYEAGDMEPVKCVTYWDGAKWADIASSEYPEQIAITYNHEAVQSIDQWDGEVFYTKAKGRHEYFAPVEALSKIPVSVNEMYFHFCTSDRAEERATGRLLSKREFCKYLFDNGRLPESYGIKATILPTIG